MSSEPRAPLLKTFLTEHDLRCEGCGYNLRQIEQPFCPECGVVIARPSVEILDRLPPGVPVHRLWCIYCGTSLAGFGGKDCPACGKALAMRPLQTDVLRAQARWFPGIPLWYLLACGLGTLTLGWGLVRLVGTFLGSVHADANLTLAGIALSAMPLLGLAAWVVLRPRIEALGGGRYRLVRNLTPLLASACVVAALRLLAT